MKIWFPNLQDLITENFEYNHIKRLFHGDGWVTKYFKDVKPKLEELFEDEFFVNDSPKKIIEQLKYIHK